MDSLFVYEVVVFDFDMRIHDDSYFSALLLKLLIELVYFWSSEVLSIELKVSVATFLRILLGPLDIIPYHVKWKP